MKPKERNFERALPTGYRQVLYINAKNAKIGIIFNLIALAVLAVVMAVASLLLHLGGGSAADAMNVEYAEMMIALLVFPAVMIGYIILHELVHGAVYKLLTGEKLTFGISWSCAFCGVPKIYTYRKTALLSVAAPFVLFTLLLIPILVWLYFVSPLYYMMMAFIFGLHLGGCCGDLYVMYLLLIKYRKNRTLMHDTGPEQFFYVPEDEEK